MADERQPDIQEDTGKDSPARENSGRENSGRDNPGRSGGDGRGFEDRRGRQRLSAEELLTKVAASNAQRNQIKLRPYLTGKILFELTDSGKKIMLDWTGDKLIAEKLEKPEAGQEFDCAISLSEATLGKIASGDVNPQIAMLSNFVNVKGKVAFAVYAFNLIAS